MSWPTAPKHNVPPPLPVAPRPSPPSSHPASLSARRLKVYAHDCYGDLDTTCFTACVFLLSKGRTRYSQTPRLSDPCTSVPFSNRSPQLDDIRTVDIYNRRTTAEIYVGQFGHWCPLLQAFCSIFSSDFAGGSRLTHEPRDFCSAATTLLSCCVPHAASLRRRRPGARLPRRLGGDLAQGLT